MARKGAYPGRRESGSLPLFAGLMHKKSEGGSPLLTLALVLLGAFLFVVYFYVSSGGFSVEKNSADGVRLIADSGGTCTLEVQRAIPVLKKAYDDSINKVLYVGPESCTVVSKLIKDGTEAWGVEPYDLDDTDSVCKGLVRKGVVRVADIKYPLAYKQKSFSLVIVSDALDYLSPNKLNKTLSEVTRVSAGSLVIFTGHPGLQRAKSSELSKFGRPAKLRSSSWWMQYFLQSGLVENEAVSKKFELARSQSAYEPSCQIFHLSS